MRSRPVRSILKNTIDVGYVKADDLYFRAAWFTDAPLIAFKGDENACRIILCNDHKLIISIIVLMA